MSLQERWLSKPVISSGFTMDQQTQKAKPVVFEHCFIRQVNTAPSNYNKNSASAEVADRTLFTSAHVEYLAAVIFYLLA